MSWASTQFQELSFCVPHAKPHGVRGPSKHYQLKLDPRLGNGKCAIIQIPFVCIACTNMLDKPWVIGSEPTRQPRYQHVEECTYWTVLGSSNNWNIIQFTNKTTREEDFAAVNKFVLDSISDNIYALVQNRNMLQ